MKKLPLALVLVSFLAPSIAPSIAPSNAIAAPDPIDRCVAAKLQATGKRFAAISKCRAKAVLAATTVDPVCLQKAEEKFLALFAKAELAGGCVFTNDAIDVDASVELCADPLYDDIARECGDGVPTLSEGCDDGGLADADGCSSFCEVDTGFSCSGAPSACAAVCGDGLLRGSETCDDLDVASGDGCSQTCALESGWDCAGAPTVCTCSSISTSFTPPSGLRLPQTLTIDASGSSASCGLPLQFFWNCTSSTSSECPNILAAANANGNTTASFPLLLQELDSFDIVLQVCIAGTSQCAAQVTRQYNGAEVTP